MYDSIHGVRGWLMVALGQTHVFLPSYLVHTLFLQANLSLVCPQRKVLCDGLADEQACVWVAAGARARNAPSANTCVLRMYVYVIPVAICISLSLYV